MSAGQILFDVMVFVMAAFAVVIVGVGLIVAARAGWYELCDLFAAPDAREPRR